MSGHIVTEIADYLEGRLVPERRPEFERHLQECTDCAADVEFAAALREHGEEAGFRHLDADRLVAAATDARTGITDAERSHLEGCSSCGEEYEWLKTHPGDDAWESTTQSVHTGRESVVGSGPQRQNRWWKPLSLGLAAAAAGMLLFVLWPERSDDTQQLRRLAVVEPIAVRVVRGPVAPGSFEAVRLRGLELYEQGDFQNAHEQFMQASTLQPDNDEVRLYLGSTELLLGNLQTADDLLRQTAQDTSNTLLREESLWQLANVELLAGDARAARATLQRVSEFGGRRASDARALLQRLAE